MADSSIICDSLLANVLNSRLCPDELTLLVDHLRSARDITPLDPRDLHSIAKILIYKLGLILDLSKSRGASCNDLYDVYINAKELSVISFYLRPSDIIQNLDDYSEFQFDELTSKLADCYCIIQEIIEKRHFSLCIPLILTYMFY